MHPLAYILLKFYDYIQCWTLTHTRNTTKLVEA